MFGLEIEHLNLRNIVNKINSHSFYAVAKVGPLPNNTKGTIKFNLILLSHRGQLFAWKIEHLNLKKIVNKINSHSFYAVAKMGALPNYTNSTINFDLILLRDQGR